MLLPLLLLAQEPLPHAAFHPVDAWRYSAVHDITSIGDAYAAAPILGFLADPQVTAVMEEFGLGPWDGLRLDSPVDLMAAVIGGMPPEAEALGLSDFLEGTSRLSYSVRISEDFEERVADSARMLVSWIELQELGERLSSAPRPVDSIEALVGDDRELAVDPWGEPYRLEVQDDLGPRILALGADRAIGGEGPAADQEWTLIGSATPETESLQPLFDASEMLVVIEFDSAALAARALELFDLMLVSGGPGIEKFALEAGADSLSGLAFSFVDEGLRFDGWLGARGPSLVLGLFDSEPQAVAMRLAGAAPCLDSSVFDQLDADFDGGTPIVTSFERHSTWVELKMALDAFARAGASEVIRRFDDDLAGVDLDRIVAALDLDLRPTLERTVMRDGVYVTESWRPGAVEVADEPSLDADSFELLEADAALVWAGNADWSSAYQGLLEFSASLRGLDAEEYHNRGAGLLGVDLREELLPLLQSQFLVSMSPIRGIGTPDLMVHLRCKDSEAVHRAIAAVCERLAIEFPTEFEVQVKPYRGMPLTRLALLGVDLGPVTIEPSFGIQGDVLVIGLSASQVKRELRRLDQGKLESHQLAALATTPTGSGLDQLVHFDWPAFLGAALDAARSLAALTGGADLGGLPLDLEQLPRGEIFTRHFTPELWLTEGREGGTLTTHRSSLGPELGAVLGGGLGWVPTLLFDTAGDEVDLADEELVAGLPTTPESATRVELDRLRVALEIYYFERAGTYPATLEELSAPTENFPRGCLDGQPLPTDGWSRPFVFERTVDGLGYLLWSLGPDGVDQQGEGDDLAVLVR
jgi:hypothetical protein